MELTCDQKTGIDYNRLFRHVEGLKKVLLVPVERSGSDFFQSLLDGHPQILQFTGIWYFHHWWKDARCKQNTEDLVNEFIWHTCSLCSHIAKFKSCYNRIERWDRLGKNKDESFETDIDSFKEHMLKTLAGKELSSRNFFLAINLAYGLATNTDIEETKMLFYHIHHMERLNDFHMDFPDFYMICTVRDPRNTLVSAMERWKELDGNTYNPDLFYYRICRVFEGVEPALQYTKNIRVLKLEDLHDSPRDVLEGFCRTYGLEFQDSLLESSYHGRKWWGDALSGRWLDGFNRDAARKRSWDGKLSGCDNFLIELILEERWRHYGYTLDNKTSAFRIFIVSFLILLPMKYELDIFAYNFKKCAGPRAIAVLAKTWARFYLSRALLYYRFFWRKLRKDVYLPDYFYKEGPKNEKL